MKTIKYTLLLLAGFLIWQCSEEDCLVRVDVGFVELTDFTRSHFPYSMEDTIAVFKDTLGNEHYAEIDMYDTIGPLWRVPLPPSCRDEELDYYIVSGKLEAQVFSVYFRELDIRFDIKFLADIDYTKDPHIYSDWLKITVDGVELEVENQSSDGIILVGVCPISLGHLLIDGRTMFPDTTIVKSNNSVELNSSKFENVIVSNRGNDQFEFYYNHEIGFLGFYDKRTEMVLSFDRFQ